MSPPRRAKEVHHGDHLADQLTRLHPGALRWARASGHYAATVAFYRDLLGLPVVGELSDSFGSDGTIFGLPDTRVQMEIIREEAGDGNPAGFDQLVLYLADGDAVTAATAPLREAGLSPDPEPHPYWAANGAVTYLDPDGRGVVFAPWVYGREPDPVDRPEGYADATRQPVRIDWYNGDRASLRHLFEEAEDSRTQLSSSLQEGRVLAARAVDLAAQLAVGVAQVRVLLGNSTG